MMSVKTGGRAASGAHWTIQWWCARDSQKEPSARSAAVPWDTRSAAAEKVSFKQFCLKPYLKERYIVTMRTVIERLVGEALTRRIPETVPRDICIKKMAGKVSVLTGMRQLVGHRSVFRPCASCWPRGWRAGAAISGFGDDRLAHVR